MTWMRSSLSVHVLALQRTYRKTLKWDVPVRVIIRSFIFKLVVSKQRAKEKKKSKWENEEKTKTAEKKKKAYIYNIKYHKIAR